MNSDKAFERVEVSSVDTGMMKESARVVAIDEQGVWLETIQRSACNACSAQKGCGQSVLGKLFDGKRHHFRVGFQHCPPELRGDLRVDDSVEIGFADQAVLKGSLVLYMIPLLAMLGGGVGLSEAMNGSDFAAILGAALGLAGGLLLVRWHNRFAATADQYQPQILRRLMRSQHNHQPIQIA